MADSSGRISADIIRSMRIPELKHHLRTLGLPCIGRKAELIERLLNATSFPEVHNDDPDNLNETVDSLRNQISKLQSQIEITQLELQVKNSEIRWLDQKFEPINVSSPIATIENKNSIKKTCKSYATEYNQKCL